MVFRPLMLDLKMFHRTGFRGLLMLICASTKLLATEQSNHVDSTRFQSISRRNLWFFGSDNPQATLKFAVKPNFREGLYKASASEDPASFLNVRSPKTYTVSGSYLFWHIALKKRLDVLPYTLPRLNFTFHAGKGISDEDFAKKFYPEPYGPVKFKSPTPYQSLSNVLLGKCYFGVSTQFLGISRHPAFSNFSISGAMLFEFDGQFIAVKAINQNNYASLYATQVFDHAVHLKLRTDLSFFQGECGMRLPVIFDGAANNPKFLANVDLKSWVPAFPFIGLNYLYNRKFDVESQCKKFENGAQDVNPNETYQFWKISEHCLGILIRFVPMAELTLFPYLAICPFNQTRLAQFDDYEKKVSCPSKNLDFALSLSFKFNEQPMHAFNFGYIPNYYSWSARLMDPFEPYHLSSVVKFSPKI